MNGTLEPIGAPIEGAVDTPALLVDADALESNIAAMKARGVRSYAELKEFVADRPGHDRRYGIDASKLRGELGWSPAHGFDDGLRRTVAWYIEHHDAFEASKVSYDRQRLGLAHTTP